LLGTRIYARGLIAFEYGNGNIRYDIYTSDTSAGRDLRSAGFSVRPIRLTASPRPPVPRIHIFDNIIDVRYNETHVAERVEGARRAAYHGRRRRRGRHSVATGRTYAHAYDTTSTHLLQRDCTGASVIRTSSHTA